jgi:4-diphosphocytidyl-2-C-methyl-D-erythritol kinase
MERYFDLNLDADMRTHILVMLGADVPICYRASTAYFSGIGDIIDNGPPLPECHILLVWPNIHCSTRAVLKSAIKRFLNQ